MTQTMKTDFDCGPVASYNANQVHDPKNFKMTYTEFLRAWKFPNTGTFKDNLRDQPGDHLTVLRKLKILHRRVHIEELLDGKAPAGKTVVLMHNPESPALQQHWVRFIRFDFLSGMYHFDWGNGSYRAYNRQKVYEMFTAGVPDYAYCIGESEPGRLARFFNWFWLQLRSLMKFVTGSR